MAITLNGTTGINSPGGDTSTSLATTNLSYTGTLTGGTGVIAIGTNQIYKDASGKLGINVTPSAATDAKLQVTGGTTNATTLATAYSLASVAVVPKSTSGYSLAVASGTGDMPLLQVSANGAAAGDLLVQPYGGNLGVGATPSYRLDVFSVGSAATETGLRITNPYTSGTSVAATNILFGYHSGAANRQSAKIEAGQQTPGTFGAGYLAFSTQTSDAVLTEAVRIDSSGNLNIGITGRPERLAVSGNSGPQALCLLYGNTAGDLGNSALVISKFDNNTTTSQVYVRFFVNALGTACGQINANGASTAAFGTYSDSRLKENIAPLPDQLANICALKPSEFDYKDGTGHQIGFIAQEMQEVYPDVVGEGDDGMLTITGWSKTEARLVKAIQELTTRLEALESQ